MHRDHVVALHSGRSVSPTLGDVSVEKIRWFYDVIVHTYQNHVVGMHSFSPSGNATVLLARNIRRSTATHKVRGHHPQCAT